VSESRAADFNGDGRLDLVVADFGWQKSGKLRLFEQRATDGGRIAFRQRMLDPRHGAMRVPPVDLDRDGRLDVVALFAQEHEALEVFLNDGAGVFTRRPLAAPADPSFGSSGLESCDLDGDGDVDFVVSNGDMFDNHFIRPFHGLRWFENQGALQFVEHSLLKLPGVHGSAAVDLDLDDDLDLVTAVCFPVSTCDSLPEAELQRGWNRPRPASSFRTCSRRAVPGMRLISPPTSTGTATTTLSSAPWRPIPRVHCRSSRSSRI
jgi:hypothetical protein